MSDLRADYLEKQKEAVREYIVAHNLEILTDEELEELIEAVQNPDNYLGGQKK